MSYAARREQINKLIDDGALWLWKWVHRFVRETGELCIFGYRAVVLFFRKPFRAEELINHMEFVGNKSLSIIFLSGLFTGLALAYQIYLGFKQVNMANMVGPVVALAIFRELGPVLTGLLVAARAGGAMAARIGTMRVTEQIDALEVIGVDPLQYLVSPRVWASVLMLPILTAFFDFIAIIGAWLITIKILEMDEAQFWDRISTWIYPYHIYEGLFKAAIFGLCFAVICTHRGYTTTGGAAGVGSSTNRGVVLSMVFIIILDFFVTNLINTFYAWKELLTR